MKIIAFILITIFGISCSTNGMISPSTSEESFNINNLTPWSIVAFDSKERSPLERVRMIKDLGFTQYAFGGRQRHINTLSEEIGIARENDIKISAVWLYLNAEKDKPGKLRAMNQRVLEVVQSANLKTQLWVGFHPKYFDGLSDAEAFDKGVEMISYLVTKASDMGCTVGLYNHGGWMGNPVNQLKIIKAINKKNIGIVYNFHHGHSDIDSYRVLFPKLMPHLLHVNLNGMKKNGPKILTIGKGEYEAEMVKHLLTLGYKGPWGILGHVKGGDAKEILQNNLKGIDGLFLPKSYKEKVKRVFLFAGQSNMEGRADAANISDADTERLESIQDRVLLHYNWREPSPLKITIPKKHTQRKFNFEVSFGPELFFGIHMAEKYTDDEFVFIKRSKGGTSLHGSWNADWTVEKAELMDEIKEPKLFQDFIKYTKTTLAAMPNNSYVIEGMLWVQGEDDSSKKRGPIPAENYYFNLKNLLNQTREQLNEPTLPLFIFQVGHGKVVKAMKQLAEEDPHVYFIPQTKKKGSKHFFDKNPAPLGHYNAEGMKKIGRVFFEKVEGSK